MATRLEAIEDRLPRCGILVVGDFSAGAPEALALRKLGARVFVVGKGTASVRREMEAGGITIGGLARARKGVAETAAGWLGAADVCLFTEAGWEHEFKEVLEAERESAAMDGRRVRPLLWRADPRYRFLRSPANWAAFAAALAAGADLETAKEFVNRHARGYTNQDSKRATRRGSREAAAKGRRKP